MTFNTIRLKNFDELTAFATGSTEHLRAKYDLELQNLNSGIISNSSFINNYNNIVSEAKRVIYMYNSNREINYTINLEEYKDNLQLILEHPFIIDNPNIFNGLNGVAPEGVSIPTNHLLANERLSTLDGVSSSKIKGNKAIFYSSNRKKKYDFYDKLKRVDVIRKEDEYIEDFIDPTYLPNSRKILGF